MQKEKLAATGVASLILFLAASCKWAASQDEFFQADYNMWVENARALPTERVYELYKQQLEMPPPSEPTLAVVLGERGKESVDMMISDLLAGESSIIKGYYPLLSEVNRRSGFNFCQSGNYYYKINRGLEKALNLSFTESMKYEGGSSTAFDRMCSRMSR